jgi:two-component system chemotaxis response regulator CheB
MSLKVLVVDDSVVFRRAISDALGAVGNVEVVGSVSNGRQALQRIRELRPDVLTLDIEMPEMDGIQLLEALQAAGDKVATIVVSALTRRGGELTMRALEKGAFDFITKPDATDAARSREAIQQALAPRLRALASRLEVRRILAGQGAGRSPPPRPPVAEPPPPAADTIAGRMSRISAVAARPELVAIGVSTGGPKALTTLIPALPANLGVPVVIVQHMPPVFTQTLAESLAAKSALKVREATDGERLLPNVVYIAPGGRQMRVRSQPEGGPSLQITDDPPENNCRPSVDYLFRSLAAVLPGRSLAVILTGMGSDGALGLRLMKRHGGLVLAQDQATCVVYGMPRAAVEAGVVDASLPLEAMAPRIVSALRGIKR